MTLDAPQVLRKTQVPPSGPQSCRQGVQDGLILREAASCCKLESRILICSSGAALAARVLQGKSWRLGFHLQHKVGVSDFDDAAHELQVSVC